MRLSAIVVAHRKETLLEQCLASLDEGLARVDGRVELVVVLNEASAEARDRLRRRARPVVLVAGAPGSASREESRRGSRSREANGSRS